jgi:membrane-associated phospholipid phosphatase
VERSVLSFSRLGEHGGLWIGIAAAGALVDTGRRGVYLRALRGVVGAYCANQAIKLVVRRRRPELDDMPTLVPTRLKLSYPSAHASTSFAGARLLSGSLPWPALYFAASVMAASRPYAGVHYPSDSLAGAALGTATALLTP